ncbi:MAG: small, acid-soluble spore protein, alpha/beta type [Bacillota bacterium]
MARGSRSNRTIVPQARPALDNLKWEVASEVGINIPKGGYGGDIPSKVWGSVGGNMVKTMIASYEQSLAGSTGPTQ